MELEYLAVVFRFYDAIRELSMEQLSSLCETKVCLSLHIIGVKKVILLLFSNICYGDSL